MNSRHSSRPKVFGVGLNKTGTTTLGTCLRALGYKHASCRGDLLRLYREGDVASVVNAARSFDSFEDWPWPLMFREFYHAFPAAKFILTTRSTPERWLESLKQHSLRTRPNGGLRKLAYGYNYPHGYEVEHLEFYRRHNAAVREFFQSRDNVFLEVCWEAGDGWDKLCPFLSQPVPHTQFPKANTSASADAKADPAIVAINQARIDRQLATLCRAANRDTSRRDSTRPTK